MANISLKSKAQGFSLMELLIVIAIIGALVAIAAASYSSAQKRTRDSRRAADLKAIQNAWEQYYADNSGLYPANCTVSMTAYLPQGLPVDPKTPTINYYANATSSCTTSAYCFCATLERTGGGNASDTSCTFGSGSYSCVKNLQ
ncbi:MAG: prepilin-type N-terminal cleavage/methylation domain-containing protein [Patescibacteria group bacterium]